MLLNVSSTGYLQRAFEVTVHEWAARGPPARGVHLALLD